MGNQFMVVEGIFKTFGRTVALNNVGFTVKEKELVCLLGPSGCGKTTLLRIIAGLEQPNAGSVLVKGADITALPPGQRSFGMVFQSYALFPNITVFHNIAYGLQNKKLGKSEIEQRIYDALRLVGLENIKDRYPAQLSGGQQQRVALARALVLSPRFLLLDEPLSALDAKVRSKLRYDLKSLQEKIGVTTIMVTHDQEEALTMADRIVVMNHAQIEQIGTPKEIYGQPRTPFVADFIGAVNFLNADKLYGGKYAGRQLAIRPEHVKLTDGRSVYGAPAVIRDIEFRGSFYRLLLKMIGENNLAADGDLVVELSPAVMYAANYYKDMLVRVEIPEEHLLWFGGRDSLQVAAG